MIRVGDPSMDTASRPSSREHQQLLVDTSDTASSSVGHLEGNSISFTSQGGSALLAMAA